MIFDKDESPREDTTIEVLRSLETGIQERWHGHRRQRSGSERWRRCAGRHQRQARERTGRYSHGAHRGAGNQRRRAQVGHDGAGGSGPQNLGKDWLEE